MKDAISRDFLKVHQAPKLVIRSVLIQPPRHQHRARKSARIAPPDTLKLGIEKTLIESGMVRNQIVIANEIAKLAHHIRAARRLSQHLILKCCSKILLRFLRD